jgi:hypothetical protein
MELIGEPVAQIPHRWQENDPWHSVNAPLHQNLEGGSSNGVLTRVDLSSVLALIKHQFHA